MRTLARSLLISVIAVSTYALAPAFAAEFSATVDREEIALDESVSLKLTVQADGSVPVELPKFTAPDFDVINEYQSQHVESYFDNGRVGARFSRSFTYVLRPKKTGSLSISGIQIQVEGQSLQAAALRVRVSGGGAATPPPQGYGGGGSGLRGSGKARRGTPIFVRAEVDKDRLYKGEQVIVSYFLYSRAAQFNAQADKFPAMPGFLKEELEMPIVQGRMADDVVTLDGQVYKRVLLARFAAYPLKEGKLTIDPFGVKVNYYDPRGARGTSDDMDAEDLFQQFFNQATPQTANVRSEPITVEVLPLAGDAPADFTGAVGDFSVISAVDRYDLRANEALTLTLKVEGQGNLSTIDTPKITLPEGFEVFESRSQTKSGRGGVGVRVFEYLLIPRRSGEFTLPAIGLSFFDPKTKSYVKKQTDPITVRVAEGDPNAAGSTALPPSRSQENREIPIPEKAIQKLYGLKSQLGQASKDAPSSDLRTLVLALFGLGILGLVAKILWPWIHPVWKKIRPANRSPSAKARDWLRMKQSVGEGSPGAPTASFRDILQAYEKISSRVYDALDARYQLGARALSRVELREVLVVENKMPEDLWNRVSQLLEFTETVRFASQAGAVSEDRVRAEVGRWIDEAEKLDEAVLKTDSTS